MHRHGFNLVLHLNMPVLMLYLEMKAVLRVICAFNLGEDAEVLLMISTGFWSFCSAKGSL